MHIHRILIYRLGSLGDTVVALPAFHLIAKSFPEAQRWVLTNFTENTKAAPLAEVLAGTELVHGYIRYPLRTRGLRKLLRLRREIRQFHPDALIYLTASRGRLKAFRDIAFFRLCGIHRIIGVPYTRNFQQSILLSTGTYEYEGARLLRCLNTLGNSNLDSEDAFDLKLSEQERAAAETTLAPNATNAPVLAVSIGAKIDVKDWGDKNWSTLLQILSAKLSGWRLITIGAAVERQRSQKLLESWSGPAMNLCGHLSARESGAVLERAHLYIGHDSGPMHLAAAVGTPCVAIFSSRNLPGVWFPWGENHRVIYTDVPCRGCRLEVCSKHAKMCIASISPDAVIRKIDDILGARYDHGTEPSPGSSTIDGPPAKSS